MSDQRSPIAAGASAELPNRLNTAETPLPASTARLLARERRFSVAPLIGGKDGGLDAMVDSVSSAIADPRFVQVLEANLTVESARGNRKGNDTKWVNRIASTPSLAPAIQAVLLGVAEELRVALKTEQAMGKLSPADMHLEALLSRKGPKGKLMTAIQSELNLGEPQRGPAFAVLLRPIKEAIAHQLTLAGKTVIATSADATLSTAVSLMHSRVGFLSSPRRCIQIGRNLADSPPEHVIDLARKVEALPDAPLVPRQSEWAGRLNDRLRHELVSCRYDQATNGALPRDAVHEKVLGVFERLFRTPGIALYLNYFANERVVMSRVADGIRRGSITLVCISCPDYSGEAKEVDGRREWSFNFRELGTGVGVVAQKGFRYVQAWAEALRPVIPEITLQHVMPTFEVADGFKARAPGVPLDHDTAVERIRATGEAIVTRYRSMGINAQSVMSCDVIPDHVFDIERARRAAELLEASAGSKVLAGLIGRVYSSRQKLYDSWQARLPDEDDAGFAVRMKTDVVPCHIAEYDLAGRLFTREEGTLMLAYDSSTMGEVHGLFRRPVMYGHDASTIDYEGAQD